MTINNETMYALEVDGKCIAIFPELDRFMEYYIELGYGPEFYKKAFARKVNVTCTNIDADPIEDNYDRDAIQESLDKFLKNVHSGGTDVQSK